MAPGLPLHPSQRSWGGRGGGPGRLGSGGRVEGCPLSGEVSWLEAAGTLENEEGPGLGPEQRQQGSRWLLSDSGTHRK